MQQTCQHWLLLLVLYWTSATGDRWWMKLVEEAGHFSRSYIIFAYLCLSLLCEQTPIGLTPWRMLKALSLWCRTPHSCGLFSSDRLPRGNLPPARGDRLQSGHLLQLHARQEDQQVSFGISGYPVRVFLVINHSLSSPIHNLRIWNHPLQGGFSGCWSAFAGGLFWPFGLEYCTSIKVGQNQF